MKFLYLDDSNIDNSDFDITALGGFIISESSYYDLQSKFQSIKIIHGLLESDPIKWSPGQSNKHFQKQRELQDINSLRDDVLQLIASSDLTILVGFINRNTDELKKLLAQERITNLAFDEMMVRYKLQSLEYLSQRFQMSLQDHNRSFGETEKGMILIEAPGTGLGPKLSKHYKEIWHHGCGAVSMKLDLLFDSIHYSHDYGSDGLQIADFITSSFCHSLRNRRYQYARVIKDKVRRRNGKVKGAGVIVYPSTSISIDPLIRQLEM